MPAKLYVVPASHPCATVARALELKGVPFEQVHLVPVFHKAAQKARFGASTVPGIVFEDGRKVVGSRAIVRALEEMRPDPPLRPADEQARHEVDLADEWGDQVLQPLVRRVVWQALGRNPSAQQSYAEGVKLVPPVPPAMARLSAGAVAKVEQKIHKAAEPNVRADLIALPGHLDRVDGWIEQGVLGGEQPNAGDLQIASALRLLLTIDDVAPLIDQRPAGALARRVFPVYPGHVPAGTLPAEWLPATSG